MSNLAVYLLNVEECYILNQQILNILKADLPEEFSIAKVLPYLEQLDRDLSAVLAKSDTTALTAERAEKDEARDIAFTAFRDYCKAFIYGPDSVKSAAAKQLEALIRRLGWSLQDEGYTEQSAALKTLIESLETPEYADAVTAVAATDWVNNMKATSVAFEEVTERRNKLVSEDNTPLTITCKKTMSRYLKPLLIYIGLMADIEPNTYNAAHAKILESVESITSVARSREARK